MKINRKKLWDQICYHLERDGIHDPAAAGYNQLFNAVSEAGMDLIRENWYKTDKERKEKQKKIACYLSIEYLIGRAFGNNFINLMAYKDVKELLDEHGIDINLIEENEPDPGLGNGGLGRLAACFLDSMTTENLPGIGYGLRYQYGIFKQELRDGYQIEHPDDWLINGYPWLQRNNTRKHIITFGGSPPRPEDLSETLPEEKVYAIAYDMPITGYGTERINTLRLWEAEPYKEFDFQLFNQGKYRESVESLNRAKDISRTLYPSDHYRDGKILRLKQEYFFVSASVQDIIHDFKEQYGTKFELLPEKAVLQLNDTHPVIAIPEMIRILMDVEGLDWDTAWKITGNCTAYTNHTILSEALEKWSTDILRPLLPRIYNIIEEINHRFLERVKRDVSGGSKILHEVSIIEAGQVHMARLALVTCYSVNGVAELHTKILKEQELKQWYELYPEKFNNKTNGVTQRRWLLKCNPKLSEFITKKIGDSWIKDLSKINKLMKWSDDKEALKQLGEIKRENKKELAEFIEENYHLSLDPDSIFDVQIKRLHEYKRQLLNILHVIFLYFKLKKDPDLKIPKKSFIFGAKAAPGYHMAKQIIKLINTVADKVNNDPDIKGKIKVLFIPNYSVSLAERLFPASDVSEQISTAGKEASGTGNMKFMMNGALTLGTMDGANIEIVQEAGRENCFIFGMSSDEISGLNMDRSKYNPKQIVENDEELKEVIESLTNGTSGDPDLFQDIYNSLMTGENPDSYYILGDFRSYAEAHERVDKAYSDMAAWQKMALKNISSSGKFSSDRTIRNYADEIWNIKRYS